VGGRAFGSSDSGNGQFATSSEKDILASAFNSLIGYQFIDFL